MIGFLNLLRFESPEISRFEEERNHVWNIFVQNQFPHNCQEAKIYLWTPPSEVGLAKNIFNLAFSLLESWGEGRVLVPFPSFEKQETCPLQIYFNFSGCFWDDISKTDEEKVVTLLPKNSPGVAERPFKKLTFHSYYFVSSMVIAFTMVPREELKRELITERKRIGLKAGDRYLGVQVEKGGRVEEYFNHLHRTAEMFSTDKVFVFSEEVDMIDRFKKHFAYLHFFCYFEEPKRSHLFLFF